MGTAECAFVYLWSLNTIINNVLRDALDVVHVTRYLLISFDSLLLSL